MTEFTILNIATVDPSYNNVINFPGGNAATQAAYFLSYAVESYTAEEFVVVPDKSDTIRIRGNYNEFKKYNYCTYLQTVNEKTKRFYAFINAVNYHSQTVVELVLSVDVMQTFMFDYELTDCFIERQHCDRWTKDGSVLKPIYNYIDEGLDIGREYKLTAAARDNNDQIPRYNLGTATNPGSYPTIYPDITPIPGEYQDTMFIYITTKEPIAQKPDGTTPGRTTNTKGLSTGIYKYFLPWFVQEGSTFSPPSLWDYNFNMGDAKSIRQDIKALSENPKVLSIEYSRRAPVNFDITEIHVTEFGSWQHYFKIDAATDEYITVYNGSGTSHTSGIGDGGTMYFIQLDRAPRRPLFTIEQPTLSDTPAPGLPAADKWESKLLTFPYVNYRITQGDKQVPVFPELAPGNIAVEYVKSTSFRNTDCMNFKGYKVPTDSEYDEGTTQYFINNNELTLRTDSWLLYEQQNKASLQSGLLTTVGKGVANVALSAAGGFLVGNVPGALIGAASGIISIGAQVAGEMQRREDIKQSPDDIRGAAGDMIASYQSIDALFIHLKKYEILPFYRDRIYKYFMRYGYKSNTFGTPDINSRYYYNYIKCTYANVNTTVNARAAQTIKGIFERGVTFWHYRDGAVNVNNFQYENIETSLL